MLGARFFVPAALQDISPSISESSGPRYALVWRALVPCASPPETPQRSVISLLDYDQNGRLQSHADAKDGDSSVARGSSKSLIDLVLSGWHSRPVLIQLAKSAGKGFHTAASLHFPRSTPARALPENDGSEYRLVPRSPTEQLWSGASYVEPEALAKPRVSRPVHGVLLEDDVRHRMKQWMERRKKLQAINGFPQAEIEDPTHEKTPFTGPAKRFFADGAAWDAEPVPGPAVPLSEQKLLQVAVVGVPNAGKSSMVNALTGSKVAAVSPKTNTTVDSALGAFTAGPSQVALFDTPGVVASSYTRGSEHRSRVRSAWGVASMCDLLLLIIDAHRQVMNEDVRVKQLVQELARGPLPNWSTPPSILVLNKVDKFSGGEGTFASVTALGDRMQQLHDFEDVYPISVQEGTGMQHLRDEMLQRASSGEWLLGPEESAGVSPAKLCEEVVREKLFQRLYDEIPYVVQFVRTAFRLASDGALLVKYNIVVPDSNLRRIVVGKRGAAIGEIGIKARREMENIFQNRVHLFLDVVVRPN